MRLWKVLSAAVFAVFALSVASASAGDRNWSGFSAGVVGSGGLFKVEQEDYWCWWACNAPTLEEWHASIGGQAAYTMQRGNFVFGLVGDISTGFENETSAHWSSGNSRALYSGEWNYYATIRARGGLALGDALLFGSAGIAIVNVDYKAKGVSDFANDGFACSSTDVDCASYNDTNIGFAAGVGLAYPVGDNLNLTFEYLLIELPSYKDRYDTDEENDPDDTDDYVNWTSSAQLARVALTWQFH